MDTNGDIEDNIIKSYSFKLSIYLIFLKEIGTTTFLYKLPLQFWTWQGLLLLQIKPFLLLKLLTLIRRAIMKCCFLRQFTFIRDYDEGIMLNITTFRNLLNGGVEQRIPWPLWPLMNALIRHTQAPLRTFHGNNLTSIWQFLFLCELWYRTKLYLIVSMRSTK